LSENGDVLFGFIRNSQVFVVVCCCLLLAVFVIAMLTNSILSQLHIQQVTSQGNLGFSKFLLQVRGSYCF
jgi:uncharacterized membrane protein YjgN (DUF898 family)